MPAWKTITLQRDLVDLLAGKTPEEHPPPEFVRLTRATRATAVGRYEGEGIAPVSILAAAASVSPMSPERVAFAGSYAPGTIVIDSSGRKLYLVQSKSSALRYPISVGREGFSWTGRERISRVADWPDWHPPKEMRERDRSLPEKMTGGVRNPLGAKALYLGNSLYRIHGTNSAQSIGRANSSGCFRMMNGHVVDLSRRVGVGTQVVVLKGLPSRVARSMRDDD
jgi:lipoprotein-anchoring transpeptidase ErfK/SrfK